MTAAYSQEEVKECSRVRRICPVLNMWDLGRRHFDAIEVTTPGIVDTA